MKLYFVLYFSLFTENLFRVNRLSYLLGLKILSLIKNRNVFSKSGNESRLRKPESFENSWQITLIMNRLTKLVRISDFILNNVYFISGNNTFVTWKNFRIYIFSWMTVTHWGHGLFIKNTQRSVIRFDEIQKNSGYPKTWKSYGYGPLIVEKKEFQTSLLTWRRGGYRFLSKKSNIISKKCVQLVNLRKVNFENKFYINKNLICIIADLNVLTLACESIKNEFVNVISNITNNSILNNLHISCLGKISTKIKTGRFLSDRKHEKYISRFEKRSWSVTDIEDKIVQRSIQIVLELIFEPSFLKNSHGFRPDRGTYTALEMVKNQFHKVTWVIKGSISWCFNTNSPILLSLLRKKISCDKTISLIYKGLETNSIDVFSRFVDFPQKSILSPILCNIYLHELDKFVFQLKCNFDKDSQYKSTSESYCNEKFVDRKCLKVSNLSLFNFNFKRLYFIRHLDNFVVGIMGSFQDALKIKKTINEFLKNQLKLNLNSDKFKISHVKKEDIFFLGTIIKSNWRKNKFDLPSKNLPAKFKTNQYLSLHVPIKKLFEEAYFQGFFRKDRLHYKPTFVGRVINLSHADILDFYNSFIYSVLNYYLFVDDYKSLRSWIRGMKFSCARTLALKYKVRYSSKIFKKYGSYLKCPITNRKLYAPNFF